MELKDCPNCHERIGINDVECPYCKYIDDSKKEPKTSNKKVVNYCFNCGTKIEKNYKYCPKCGVDLLNKEIVKQENNDINNNTNIGNKKEDGTICIIIFVVSILLNIILNSIGVHNSQIFTLLGLVSLVSIVTGKIKYPKNKIITILFWLFLITVILILVYIIVMMILCISAIPSCIEEMRNCG